MVIVDDDIALPDLPQSRGVAGTLFVHKIAGAMAESGASLDDVIDTARRVIANTRSIGIALDTCTVPGSPKEKRIPEGHAELGLGIHGEAGVEQIEYDGVRGAVAAMVDRLAAGMEDKPHVVLVNNLGGTSVLEMAVVVNELVQSAIGARLSHIVGPAAMMTSLDMQGFSISVLPAEKADLDLLAKPVGLAAWPGVTAMRPVNVIALPDGLTPIAPLASQHLPTRQFLTECCKLLIEAEKHLNALDAKSGDGDTGSTLASAARALIEALDRLPLADHTQLFRAMGQELSQTMGGSSGVLLAIFFAAAGDGASSGLGMRDALKAGLARMQEIGGAELGDRTMVDALSPALDAYDKGFAAAASAARAGANLTATYLSARAGRAAYINARQLEGHIDPGAEAVARLFEFLSLRHSRSEGKPAD
jgi:dihydroxyacetone kinase